MCNFFNKINCLLNILHPTFFLWNVWWYHIENHLFKRFNVSIPLMRNMQGIWAKNQGVLRMKMVIQLIHRKGVQSFQWWDKGISPRQKKYMYKTDKYRNAQFAFYSENVNVLLFLIFIFQLFLLFPLLLYFLSHTFLRIHHVLIIWVQMPIFC